MAREVECKLRVDAHEVAALSARIDRIFPDAQRLVVDKQDIYYHRDDPFAQFRIRRDGQDVYVTRKHKEQRSDGFEVNEEIEFTVEEGDGTVVHRFFESLGYRPMLEKMKRGTMWKQGLLTVELVAVGDLGHFLEIELLLADTESEEAVLSALHELDGLRKTLGVADRPLEPRYYSEMLGKVHVPTKRG